MSPGRKILLAILQRTALEFVAARVGVSPSTVSRWASGDTRPSAVHALRLVEAYPEEFAAVLRGSPRS